jgi:hypothetical protein
MNRMAMAEAARQIRLRNLAGPILIDPAGLSRKERGNLAAPLREALAGDSLAQFKGVGPLGLFEILRRRVHPPLHEVLGGQKTAVTAGLAALRQAAREAAAAPGRQLALRSSAAVVTALRGLPLALEAFAAETGRALPLVADLQMAPGAVSIEDGPDHAG